MKAGLLGRKLGHSYSPQIHACLGDYSYELFEREPEDVENFLKTTIFPPFPVFLMWITWISLFPKKIQFHIAIFVLFGYTYTIQ